MLSVVVCKTSLKPLSKLVMGCFCSEHEYNAIVSRTGNIGDGTVSEFPSGRGVS